MQEMLITISARLNRRTVFCRQGIIPRATQLHRDLSTPFTQQRTTTMKSLSPALASLANVFKIPMSMAPVRPSISRTCHETLNRQTQQPGPVTAALQSAPFSTSSTMAARKGNAPAVDKRISTCHFIPRAEASSPEPGPGPRVPPNPNTSDTEETHN